MKMKLQWPRIPVPTYRTLRIANYTVAAMAAAMAVTVEAWEEGKVITYASDIDRLCAVLDIQPNDLLIPDLQ